MAKPEMKLSSDLLTKFSDVDPFLLKKWERIFNVFFDRNASAEVDWGDFYLVVRHVRDIYGAQSEQMKYARNSMKALWEGLKKEADKNNDELITIEEWITIIRGTDPKHENPWFMEYLTFMFKLFDVSADNVVDINEYADGMVAHGFEDHVAREGFPHIAVDNKGKPIKALNKEQWKQRWDEYMFSTDPKSPGNHMFGVMHELLPKK
jgi:Ca2+-binding EF-hand superfamily protein